MIDTPHAGPNPETDALMNEAYARFGEVFQEAVEDHATKLEHEYVDAASEGTESGHPLHTKYVQGLRAELTESPFDEQGAEEFSAEIARLEARLNSGLLSEPERVEAQAEIDEYGPMRDQLALSAAQTQAQNSDDFRDLLVDEAHRQIEDRLDTYNYWTIPELSLEASEHPDSQAPKAAQDDSPPPDEEEPRDGIAAVVPHGDAEEESGEGSDAVEVKEDVEKEPAAENDVVTEEDEEEPAEPVVAPIDPPVPSSPPPAPAEPIPATATPSSSWWRGGGTWFVDYDENPDQQPPNATETVDTGEKLKLAPVVGIAEEMSPRHSVYEDRHVADNHRHHYAVIDGMGGHGSGDVAAETIANSLDQSFIDYEGTWAVSRASSLMKTIFMRAKDQLDIRAQDPDVQPGMGAVLTAIKLFEEEDKVWVAYGHAGDTRLYVVDPNGAIRQVTEDESWEIDGIRQGNVVTNYIADGHELKLDQFGVFELPPGARLLLNSDGLTGDWHGTESTFMPSDQIPEDKFRRALRVGDPQRAAEKLRGLHIKKDDVTVLVIDPFGRETFRGRL